MSNWWHRLKTKLWLLWFNFKIKMDLKRIDQKLKVNADNTRKNTD